LVSEVSEVIDEVTKNSQFANNEFKNKLKSIMSSVEEKDSYIFTGPHLSGKSMALDTVSKIAKILNEYNVYDNPQVKYVKIFPKSFEPSAIFSDIERYSQLQIYSKKDYNLIYIQISLFIFRFANTIRIDILN
jgi:hypothetical protein